MQWSYNNLWQENVFGFIQNVQLWLNLIANCRYIHLLKEKLHHYIISLSKYYASWSCVSSIIQPSKNQDKSIIFLKMSHKLHARNIYIQINKFEKHSSSFLFSLSFVLSFSYKLKKNLLFKTKQKILNFLHIIPTLITPQSFPVIYYFLHYL